MIIDKKQTYVYVIVHKVKGSILLESATLPIFWRKKVALQKAIGYPDCEVKRISMSGLIELINNKTE